MGMKAKFPYCFFIKGAAVMKKTILIVISCVALVVIGFFIFKPELKQEIVPIGGKFVLSAEDEKKAGTNGALFSWDKGTVEMTITDMKVFDNYEDAEIKAEDMGSLQENKDYYFVLLDLNIKNINASHYNTNDINLYMFKPMSEDNFLEQKEEISEIEELAYLDCHATENKEVKYFHINLNKGEEINCKLGMYVKREVLDKNKLFLKVGSMPLNKYAFALKKKVS